MDNENKPQSSESAAPEGQQNVASATSSTKTNTLAIIAIICAILFPPIGLVLGIVALSQIKKNKEGGKGLAIGSIVVSSILIIGYVLIWVFVLGSLAMFNQAAQNAGVNVNTKTGTVTTKDANGNTTTTQTGSNVSLPSGFPSSMPIYPGAKLVSALKQNQSDYYVSATSTDKSEKVAEYYKSELVKNGWTIDSTSENSDTSGTATFFNVSSNQYTGSVSVTAPSAKESSIAISVYPKN